MSDKNDYLEGPNWYVAHTYSGYENKVKANIEKSIKNLHLEDQIFSVEVPLEEVVEVKDGVRKEVSRKLFPGYVLLHMIMNDETWYVVRNTRGVTGFVGPESKPVPLTAEDLAPFGIKIDEPMEEEAVEETETEKQIVMDIEVGDAVTVVAGAWEGHDSIVKAVNPSKSTVTITVEMFGRETPVEISFLEIRKM